MHVLRCIPVRGGVTRNMKLLIVDNYVAYAETLGCILACRGYEVSYCNSGFLAVSAIHKNHQQNEKFDAILCTKSLPDMGVRRLSKIIDVGFGIPFFMMTESRNCDFSTMCKLAIENCFFKPALIHEAADKFEACWEDYLSTRQKIKFSLEKKTVGCHCLIKLKHPTDVIAMYKEFSGTHIVSMCRSLYADYDFLINLAAHDHDVITDYISAWQTHNKIEQIISYEICDDILPQSMSEITAYINQTLGENSRSGGVESYVCLSIDPACYSHFFPILKFDKLVRTCHICNHGKHLVLLLHAPNYAQINKLINNKFRYLDGVNKITQYPIIDIYDDNLEDGRCKK